MRKTKPDTSLAINTGHFNLLTTLIQRSPLLITEETVTLRQYVRRESWSYQAKEFPCLRHHAGSKAVPSRRESQLRSCHDSSSDPLSPVNLRESRAGKCC